MGGGGGGGVGGGGRASGKCFTNESHLCGDIRDE